MNSVINAKDLTHTYPDGTNALDGLTFRVEENERVALIGANGAGKSTFLLHLNGLMRGKGHLEVLGMEVRRKNYRAIRQRVGMVLQRPDDQLFCTTIMEDIAFGPRNMGLPESEIEERSRNALADVRLVHVAEKSAFHLSAGEKKRAALATVLSMRPEILVLDEPTSGLDPKSRKELAALLRQVGGTQLFATHDFTLAKALATRVVVLYQGKAVAGGTPFPLLEDQATLAAYDLA